MESLQVTARSEAARCAYCHDAAFGLVQVCPGCGTSLHVTCKFLLRRCPTLGCVYEKPRRIRVDAAPARTPSSSPRVTWRDDLRAAFWFLVFASVAVGVGIVTYAIPSNTTRAASEIRADLNAIDHAARLFRLNTKRWPSSIEELQTPPHDVADRWQGPYLETLPRDPWDRPYRLYPGRPPVVVCFGEDGLAGGSGESADVIQAVRAGRRTDD